MNYYEVFHLQEWNGWYFVQNYQWPRAIFFFFASGKAIFCQNAQPRVENKSSHIFQKLQVTYNKIVHTIFWRQYTRSFL